MNISRREAMAAIGTSFLGFALGSVSGCKTPHETNTVTPPAAAGTDPAFWTPHKLDPDETALRAYNGFYNNNYGCCYGVFSSVIGQMGEKYGEPYSSFPSFMMKFGYSGVSNWGTLCGSLMGAAAMYALFYVRTDRDPMIDELFTWYEKASLPEYKPETPKLDVSLEQTLADSVLCHVSVSKWCYKSGHEMSSKERSERCARVTGDVAKKAVEILNAKIDGQFRFAGYSESVKYCGECHGKGKVSDISKSKMECAECHDDKFENHH